MRETTVARAYAETFYDVAFRGGGASGPDDFAIALDAVAAVTEGDARIRAFLRAPTIAVADKAAALTQAFTGKLPDTVLHFLIVVVRHRRERLIAAIASAYRELLQEKTGRVGVLFQVARDASAEERASMEQKLASHLKREIDASWAVEPALLGGFVARFGDRVVDGSLHRRLSDMRRRLLAAPLS